MRAHKISWYKDWHQWNFSHHFHVLMLVFYIASILLGSLAALLPGNSFAAGKDWAFNEGTPSNYYSYNGTKITVGGGTASLGNHTPGADWIADAGGAHFYYRKALTISNSGGALTNYQIPVTISLGADSTKLENDCKDLRFAKSDGATALDYWVESCSATSVKAWVEVDTIAASPANTTIYMYYGNLSATTTSSDTNTFVKIISNVQGAWTMDETSGTNVADYHNSHSLGQPNDATATETTIVDGNNGRGKAREFNDVFDKIRSLDTDNNLDTASGNDGKITISAWIYPTTDNNNLRFILEKGDNASNNYRFRINGNETLNFSYQNPVGTWKTWPSTGVVSYNVWQHVAVSVSTDGSGVVSGTFYINGATAGTFTGGASLPMLTNDKSLNIGYGELVSYPFLGVIDEPRVYMNNLGQADIQALAGANNISYFSPADHPNTEYIRQYSATVTDPLAITDIDSSSGYDGYYYNDYPTIQNVEGGNGVSYSYISAMSVTTGGTGSARFQVSSDNGATWYRWNGSAWVTVSDPNNYSQAETNTSSEVTTNISAFRPGGANPRNFRWRAFLVSDGTQVPTITAVSMTYVTDTAVPNNPVIGGVTAYESDGGPTWTYDAGQLWHNYAAPKFVWTPPSDNAGVGEEVSNVWRYYAKLTTDSGYIPTSADATTNNYLVASGLTNGQTYYLRVKTIDNAENESAVTTLLTYKYDNTASTDPSNLQANTLQPTDQPLSFSWDASTDVGNIGERSEFDHYEYKKGSISNWQSTTNTSVSGITGDEDGNNTFRVKAVDKAGNVSGEETIIYNYILNAPSEPLNLTVTDQSKTVNNFEFSWGVPSYVEPGYSIAGYKFFVNEMPSAFPQNDYSYMGVNKNDIGNVLTKSGIRATKQGVNRFYVVAYDTEGKINYSNYAWKDFQIDTTVSAPTAPQNVVISDVSDRHNPDHYALALSWKPPANYDSNTFGNYNIRRTNTAGLNDAEWLALNPVGTTTSPAYAEANLTQNLMYYYRISAVDNAGAELLASLSEEVSKAPTGKYITPPTDSIPVVSVTATTATITWTTDRISYSKVEYGKTASYGMQNSSLQTTTNHSVTLYGLDPGTVYHYRTQSLDSADQEDYNDNDAYSADYTFSTQPAPGISDVKISDIRLDSAIVTWKTTSSATSTVKYGKTNSYGKEIVDSSGSSVTTHTVKLPGLDHSSVYSFKIYGADTDGNQMQSDNYSFETLTFPKISNVRFQQMKNTATSTLKVTWDSNVPVSSVVQYTDPTGKTQEAAQSQLVSSHELIVSGLKDNTDYTLVVRGRDAYGNEGLSETEKVKTDFDTRPPEISEITTETSISGYGSSAKSQLIVSWYTDEPSTSQVEYAKGVSGDTYTSATKEDSMLTTSHVVVVSDLDPSSSYYFRVVSKDTSKNEAKSDAQSALTEQARSSIFDIVLKSFESTLGWLFSGKR